KRIQLSNELKINFTILYQFHSEESAAGPSKSGHVIFLYLTLSHYQIILFMWTKKKIYSYDTLDLQAFVKAMYCLFYEYVHPDRLSEHTSIGSYSPQDDHADLGTADRCPAHMYAHLKICSVKTNKHNMLRT
ncbi:hypothetical protein ACJX0J_020934, partial [Zea mays]